MTDWQAVVRKLASRLDQKESLSASWITRADSPVAITLAELGVAAAEQQVRPKPVEVMWVEPSEESRGVSKFGWLSALKNSALN